MNMQKRYYLHFDKRKENYIIELDFDFDKVVFEKKSFLLQSLKTKSVSV
jgi:hypothetical protein